MTPEAQVILDAVGDAVRPRFAELRQYIDARPQTIREVVEERQTISVPPSAVNVDLGPVVEALGRMTEALAENTATLKAALKALAKRPDGITAQQADDLLAVLTLLAEKPARQPHTLRIKHADGTESTVEGAP